MISTTRTGAFGAALTLLMGGFFLSYSIALAQSGASTVANVTCVACVAEAKAKKQDPLTYCKPRVCSDPTNGTTNGHCVLTECRAENFSGAGQSGNAGLDQVAKILGDLMGKLMQQGQQGQQGQSQTPQQTETRCTQYVLVSDVSQLQGNPCATYVAPVSSQINGGSSLSEALGDTSGSSLSDALLSNTNTNTNTSETTLNTSDTNAGTRSTTTATTTLPVGSTLLVPPPGLSGDIQVLNNGATIVAGTRDVNANQETAGFYGAGSFGEQPKTLVGRWCQSRPWAANFLSAIVPSSFFDSLCVWRGYQVGVPPQQSPSLQQKTVSSGKATPAAQASTSTASAIPPKVDIWAVPAAVPLGARTTIFWNTQGVSNCVETSPDGNFNHATLSGGAATVPITGATTFTISCDAPDGSHVTGYVTVNLSI